MEISLSDPQLKSYAFYASILVIKLLMMAPLTSRQRIKKKAFASPEDVAYYNDKKAVVKHDDDSVERVRRAHLNDLENIPAFLFIGGLYLLTDPSPVVAEWLFRAYTAARVGHTLVYAVVPVPQPARGLCFGVGFGITLYMAGSVIAKFM